MNKFTLALMAILFILIFMTAMVLNDVKSETIPVKADETSGIILEETAGAVDGVIQAEWNDLTQELEVVFDGTKTDLNAIESAIEKSGFETLDSSKTEALEGDVLKGPDSGNKNDPKPALRSNAASKAEGF
jgi:copper chaperone CopZ